MDDEPRRFFGPKDVGGGRSDSGPPPPRLGEPLSAADADKLMGIVGVESLPETWKQGFFFAGYQAYGLQQVEGGPCGVLAVVQAFLIRSLLERSGGDPGGVLEANETVRQDALCDALSEILWRNVGDGKKAVLFVPSAGGATVLSASALRCLQPATFSSYEQLRYSLTQRPYSDLLFNPSGCGIPLLLYSLVWTRGVENIRDRDVDDPKTGVMIGSHGYCTQELVNLMVFGRAYSNVFDGTKRLGSPKDGWCVLQGAPRRPDVGFLSLFEAFKCIEVGSRYKGPTAPVWIVCAESHYSVLFAVDSALDPRDSERPMDIFYFDQLARQSEKIKLSIEPKNLPGRLSTGFEESESMIDRCIRTKWTDANINWNGMDPIL